MNDETDNSQTNDLIVKIKWGSLAQVPTLFANQLLITHTGSEFFLVFGELVPPIHMEADDEMPEFVEVKPLIKVALTPEAAISISEALKDNVRKYMDRNQ